jgi:hypothetical protein
MKKVIILCAVVLTAGLSANAQFFVSGAFGLGFDGTKYKSGSSSNDGGLDFRFDLSPSVGYYLSDRFALALNAGYGRSSSNDRAKDYTKSFSNEWIVSPFARYHAVEVNNFALILEGGLFVGGEQSKTKDEASSTTKEWDPIFRFGLGVYPVLAYSLTDKLSIEARCDFLNVGFSRSTTKIGNDSDNKRHVNSMGVGVNWEEGEGFLQFHIGMTYKF